MLSKGLDNRAAFQIDALKSVAMVGWAGLKVIVTSSPVCIPTPFRVIALAIVVCLAIFRLVFWSL